MTTNVPNVPTYTGEVPLIGQGETEFSQNAQDSLQYQAELPTNLNSSISAMNTLGGEVETLAQSAELSNSQAAAVANFKGDWSGLTGALSNPASVKHNGLIWLLLKDLADVTASEPSVTSDWEMLGNTASLKFDTIADLEAANLPVGAFAHVKWVNEAGKVGGGLFEIVTYAEAISRGITTGYTITNNIFSGEGFLIANGNVAVVNDNLFAFQNALLSASGVAPNGIPDTVSASKYLDAIRAIIDNRSVLAFATVEDLESATAIGGELIDLDKASANGQIALVSARAATDIAGITAYKILTAAAYGSAPDGEDDFYIGGGTSYVARKLDNGQLNTTTFGVDSAPERIKEASEVASSKRKTLLIESGLQQLDIDFTQIGDNTPVITTTGSWATQQGGALLRPKSGVDYEGDAVAGDVVEYKVFWPDNDHTTIFGQKFDGQELGVNSGYDDSIVNVRFTGVFCSEIAPARLSDIKVLGSTVIAGSGHAVNIQNSDAVCVGLNYFSDHQGFGFGGNNTLGLLFGNISRNAYDAPIVMNSVTYSAAVGNVCLDNSNGAFADPVGASHSMIVANLGAGHSKRGIQVRQSPNTGAEIDGFLVASNYLYNNTKSDKTGNIEQAEITFGKDASSENGRRAAAIGNFLNVHDSSGEGGTAFNRAFYAADGIRETSFNGNVIAGELQTGQYMVVVDGAEDTNISHNVGITQNPTTVRFEAYTGRLAYAHNQHMTIDPESPVFPSEMIVEDGYMRYNVVRFLPITDTDIVTINWPGGFEIKEVELTMVQAGDRGAIRKRVVARGASGLTTAILDNTDNYNVGTQPPIITVDTSTTGVLKLLGRVQGGAATDKVAVHIKVIGSERDNVDVF